MPARLRINSGVCLAILAAAILIALLLLPGWLFFRSLEVDYGALPPARVFQQVFRRPIPDGLSNLRIAGHGFVQGHTVWMRFQVTDDALKTLIPEAGHPPDPKKHSLKLEPWIVQSIEQRDPRSVRWDEVLRIARPEYYDFSTTDDSQGWYGFFILDRQQHVVYLQTIVL